MCREFHTLAILRPKYTPEAHAKAIGEEKIGMFAPQPIVPWSGTMTDEYRERVRRDLAIEKIIQYSGGGEWFRSLDSTYMCLGG